MNKVKLPSNKVFGIFFAVIFLALWLYFLKSEWLFVHAFIVIAITFFILGILNSHILHPLNYAWYKFGLALGFIISPIILLLIYIFLFVPIGLILKIIKKDVLKLKIDSKKSFWETVEENKINMDNQY